MATNALGGNIWDNFSSQSYKHLPSVGTITVRNPFTGESRPYAMPAGGRGYTRPPSLVGVWSTAPFLLNNTVGPFDQDPSVDARMRVFNASIEQMLWPEKRERDALLGNKGVGVIDRTTARSTVTIPKGYVPDILEPLQGTLNRWMPWLFSEGGDITIGPIPSGVPINLLANIQPLSETDDLGLKAQHVARIVALLAGLKSDLKAMPANATDEQLRELFANQVQTMLSLNKCPDFEVNRGHYFGTATFNDMQTLS